MTNILVIDGHPDPDRARFVHALADAYADGARAGGHQLRRIEVARLDFPLVRSRADWTGGAPPAVIAAAQEDIRWARHIVFLYPLWLGDVPALFKGFLEQVAREGFALAPGRPKGLLGGRSARLVVTMGMPAIFYRLYFGGHSVKSLRRNVLNLVGIKPVRTSLVGNVEGDAKTRARWLATMSRLGRAAR